MLCIFASHLPKKQEVCETKNLKTSAPSWGEPPLESMSSMRPVYIACSSTSIFSRFMFNGQEKLQFTQKKPKFEDILTIELLSSKRLDGGLFHSPSPCSSSICARSRFLSEREWSPNSAHRCRMSAKSYAISSSKTILTFLQNLVPPKPVSW